MKNHHQLWPFSEIPPNQISIYDGPEAFLASYETASVAHRISFCAFWLQAEVLNGGLSQFFSNSTGVLAPEAVAACRMVKMPILAEKVEHAMSWFGPVYPRDRGVREEALERHAEMDPDAEDPFSELDDEVANLIYEEGIGLEKSMEAYLERNDG